MGMAEIRTYQQQDLPIHPGRNQCLDWRALVWIAWKRVLVYFPQLLLVQVQVQVCSEGWERVWELQPLLRVFAHLVIGCSLPPSRSKNYPKNQNHLYPLHLLCLKNARIS